MGIWTPSSILIQLVKVILKVSILDTYEMSSLQTSFLFDMFTALIGHVSPLHSNSPAIQIPKNKPQYTRVHYISISVPYS